MTENTVAKVPSEIEDAAWTDAYRIAWVGASNPIACANALAKHSHAMLSAIGTNGVKKHPALRAIAGHLASLYGYGMGPDEETLVLAVENAKRLGIWMS